VCVSVDEYVCGVSGRARLCVWMYKYVVCGGIFLHCADLTIVPGYLFLADSSVAVYKY
jgi:hypothetical protein